MKTKLEKDVETTIGFLRYLTGGQGFASIGIFDIGFVGGLDEASVIINLERDGKSMNKIAQSPEELKQLLITALVTSTPFYKNLDEMNEHYKNHCKYNK